MTELFESTMDNVSGLEVKGYSDPVKMERTMEIWVKRGDEEYLYKFTGPGVDKFEVDADGRCWIENKKLKEAYEKLSDENKQLKKENEADDKILEYIAMNNRLEEENEKLKKELHSLKTMKKSNLPETPITDAMLVNYYNRLEEDNEKLKEKNKSLKDNYKMLGKAFDKVNRLLKYRDEQLENLKKELSLEKDVNEAQHKNTRADILDQAKKCVCGHREQDYGTPESNFQLIADLWNGYLGFMDHPQDQIRATDVAMLMALMKIARIRNGGGSGDSFVDLAGYAACGGEIWDGERHK